MRTVFHHAAVAAFLAAGLAAGAWGQMQTPSGTTAPNGARVPSTGNSALPPGPPGVPAKPGDPLPPPSDLTPNATPRYATNPGTSTSPDAAPGTPPSTTQQDDSRARTPSHRMHRDDATSPGMHRDERTTHRASSRSRMDNSMLPQGLRQCADMTDRDERARCASDLYDENGQPKR